MSDEAEGPSREQQLYLRKFVALSVDVRYVSTYRDQLGQWVTAAATIRAVTSSASIGAWVVWKQYAFVWASLIAVSQVMDGLQEVFPLLQTEAGPEQVVENARPIVCRGATELGRYIERKMHKRSDTQMLHSVRTRKQQRKPNTSQWTSPEGVTL